MGIYQISDVLVKRLIKSTGLTCNQVLNSLRNVLDRHLQDVTSRKAKACKTLNFPGTNKRFYADCRPWKSPIKGFTCQAYSSSLTALDEQLNKNIITMTDKHMDKVGEDSIGDEMDEYFRQD